MDRMEPSFDVPPHTPHRGHEDPFSRSRYYDQATPPAHAHDPYARGHAYHEHHTAHAQLHMNAPDQHAGGGYSDAGHAQHGYSEAGYDDGYPAEDMPYRPRRRFLSRIPVIAGLLILGVWAPITFNAMWLQDGPHPAPFFAGGPQAPANEENAQAAPSSGTAQVSTPREASARNQRPTPQPATTAATPAPQPATQPQAAPQPSREQRELAEIQTVLQRLGLYDGAIDGLYGPRTRAAIEAFETGHGLAVSGRPSAQLRAKLGLPAQSALASSATLPQDAQSAAAPAVTGIADLLDSNQAPAATADPIAQAIIDHGDKQPPAPGYTQAYTQVQSPAPTPAPAPAPTAPALPQPALAPPTGVQTISISPPAPATALLGAERPRPGDPRVLHVQRLLADLAYAPGSIDGQLGPSTRAAIMRFEADRNMAQTGQVSDQLLKELAAMTGVTYGG
jgi:peptidoglycan hydrolase-like protein with peptidoglycan-binding domain